MGAIAQLGPGPSELGVQHRAPRHMHPIHRIVQIAHLGGGPAPQHLPAVLDNPAALFGAAGQRLDGPHRPTTLAASGQTTGDEGRQLLAIGQRGGLGHGLKARRDDLAQRRHGHRERLEGAGVLIDACAGIGDRQVLPRRAPPLVAEQSAGIVLASAPQGEQRPQKQLRVTDKPVSGQALQQRRRTASPAHAGNPAL